MGSDLYMAARDGLANTDKALKEAEKKLTVLRLNAGHYRRAMHYLADKQRTHLPPGKLRNERMIYLVRVALEKTEKIEE